jgi:hypothetical protein
LDVRRVNNVERANALTVCAHCGCAFTAETKKGQEILKRIRVPHELAGTLRSSTLSAHISSVSGETHPLLSKLWRFVASEPATTVPFSSGVRLPLRRVIVDDGALDDAFIRASSGKKGVRSATS